jgi:hypothetical protein
MTNAIIVPLKLDSQKLRKFHRPGIAALLVVVIVGGAALLMALSVSILGLNDMEMGYNSQNGQNVFSLTDSCGEEALLRLKRDSNYAGGTLNLGGGSCIITVIGDLPDKIITLTGNLGDYNNKIQITAAISEETVTVVDWTELAN